MATIILKEKDFECKNWKDLYDVLEQSQLTNTKVFSPVVPHLFRKYVQAKLYRKLEVTEIIDNESAECGLFRLSIINRAPAHLRPYAGQTLEKNNYQ